MDKIVTKLLISAGASLAVTENVNLQPLWTALITLAVSLLTVLSVEGVAWLKAWFNKKKAKENSEEKSYEKKCEEADEICEIVSIEQNHSKKKKED